LIKKPTLVIQRVQYGKYILKGENLDY